MMCNDFSIYMYFFVKHHMCFVINLFMHPCQNYFMKTTQIIISQNSFYVLHCFYSKCNVKKAL